MKLRILLAALVFFLVRNQHVTATTITFDDVASGTLINAQYSGVTFGCFNGTGVSNLCSGNPTNVSGAGNAYAVSSPTAASPSNVISFTSGIPLGVFAVENLGFFSATFSSPVSSVSIDALPVLAAEGVGAARDVPFIQAFNSAGQFLTSASYVYGACNPLTTACPYQTLTVSNPNIAFVAFSSTTGAGSFPVFGMFDNLTFTGNGSGTVPEPSTLLLLSSGLFAMRVWRGIRKA